MIHGPCGELKINIICIYQGVCTKHYPKKFCLWTIINKDGYPIYKRRNDSWFVMVQNQKLNSNHIVPYNHYLLVIFQDHIKVEWNNRARSVKYLFKYITKGPGQSKICIKNIDGTTNWDTSRQWVAMDE